MFENVINTLQNMAYLDVILPFLLIVSILYVAIAAVPNFNRNSAIVISLSIALITIITHLLGLYPECWDVVVIINGALPKVALLIVAIVAVFLLLGIFGMNMEFFQRFLGVIGAGIIGFIAYAFLTSGGEGCNALEDLSVTFPIFDWPSFGFLEWLIPLFLAGLFLWFIISRFGRNNGGGGGGSG